MMYAEPAIHRVRAGRTSTLGSLSGLDPDRRIDVAGSHPRATPNNTARIIPVTNSGNAISASETAEIAWSRARPCHTPAIVPSSIATGSITNSAAIARTTLLPTRAEMKAVTGWCEASERPRSPCKTPSIHDPY